MILEAEDFHHNYCVSNHSAGNTEVEEVQS